MLNTFAYFSSQLTPLKFDGLFVPDKITIATEMDLWAPAYWEEIGGVGLDF